MEHFGAVKSVNVFSRRYIAPMLSAVTESQKDGEVAKERPSFRAGEAGKVSG